VVGSRPGHSIQLSHQVALAGLAPIGVLVGVRVL
jgi:hypothetical protein